MIKCLNCGKIFAYNYLLLKHENRKNKCIKINDDNINDNNEKINIILILLLKFTICIYEEIYNNILLEYPFTFFGYKKQDHIKFMKTEIELLKFFNFNRIFLLIFGNNIFN